MLYSLETLEKLLHYGKLIEKTTNQGKFHKIHNTAYDINNFFHSYKMKFYNPETGKTICFRVDQP